MRPIVLTALQQAVKAPLVCVALLKQSWRKFEKLSVMSQSVDAQEGRWAQWDCSLGASSVPLFSIRSTSC